MSTAKQPASCSPAGAGAGAGPSGVSAGSGAAAAGSASAGAGAGSVGAGNGAGERQKRLPRPLPKAVPSPHFIEDCPTWVMPGPGVQWSLRGHSQAGERTGFQVRELRLFLDAGMNTYQAMGPVLVTHSHADHSFNVPCICMGQGGLLGARPDVYIPAAASEPLQLMCRAAQALNDSAALSDKPEVNCCPVRPGDKFRLLPAKKKAKNSTEPTKGCCTMEVEVEVVSCVHRVPTVGYIVSSVKKKLKDEYVGLPGKELGRLRKSGLTITQEVVTPRFCFLGDTTVDVFKISPQVLDVPIVIVECTLLFEADEPRAAHSQHMCWSQLRPIVSAHPHTTFCLIHFSRKYKDADVAAVFDSEEGGHPENVVLFLDSGVRTHNS